MLITLPWENSFTEMSIIIIILIITSNTNTHGKVMLVR